MSYHDRSISLDVMDIMKCAICLDMPTEPKLLTCAHMFCLECLRGHLAASMERFISRRITCPQCRQGCNLPPGGVDHLPTDFRAMQLAELIDKRQKAKEANKKPIVHQMNLDIVEEVVPDAPSLDPETIKEVAKNLNAQIRFSVQRAKAILDPLSVPDRREVVSELIGNNTALTQAIDARSVELMVYFLEECGADVEQHCVGTVSAGGQREESRGPPLSKAVHSKNIDAVQALISHSADVNARDTGGLTPLHMACRKAEMDIVRLLVESSADVNIQDNYGVTCLMHAKKRPEIRAYLVSRGANVNLANIYGMTALHYAVDESCQHSVKVLLEEGATTHNVGDDGNTVLHAAVTGGDEDIVRILIQHGADPYKKNTNNEDCILTAVLKDRHRILKCLVRHHKSIYY